MDRPVNCQQLDLLVCASGALEDSVQKVLQIRLSVSFVKSR